MKPRGLSSLEIPFCRDHGHEMPIDRDRGYVVGYPLVGRLRGLAEVRGVIRALNTMRKVA